MGFNFNNLGNIQATASTKKILRPWNIYPVKFMGCSIDSIQGKKDPSITYDIFKISFEGEDGSYEENVFFPKEGDDERPVYKNKEGHDYSAPSSLERTQTLIAQLCAVLNPEGFEKLQKISSEGKLKTFMDVCKAVIKITDPKKGCETHLKLVGVNRDGQVRSALPKLCGVAKDGRLFTSDNFIGDNLFFTPYEEGKRKEYESAAPTPISAPVSSTNKSESNSVLDDLDSLAELL